MLDGIPRAPIIILLLLIDLYTFWQCWNHCGLKKHPFSLLIKLLLNLAVFKIYIPLWKKRRQSCYISVLSSSSEFPDSRGTHFSEASEGQHIDSDKVHLKSDFPNPSSHPYNAALQDTQTLSETSEKLRQASKLLKPFLKATSPNLMDLPNLQFIEDIISLSDCHKRAISRLFRNNQQAVPEMDFDPHRRVSGTFLCLFADEVLREIRTHKAQNYVYCNECKQTRPPRSHHCSKTGKCLDEMDHYCPSLAISVFRHNRRYFVQFVAWASFSLLFSICWSIPPVVYHFHRCHSPQFMFGLILLFVLLLFVGMLSVSQVVLMLSGQTTIEESIDHPRLRSWLQKYSKCQESHYLHQKYGVRESYSWQSHLLVRFLWQMGLSPCCGWKEILLPIEPL